MFQPILYISDNTQKKSLEYISKEILTRVGISSNFRITENTKTALVISKEVVIPESKLRELFNIISLLREDGKGYDTHGRFNQENTDWNFDIPEFDRFILDVKDSLGGISETEQKRFKVIFTHDLDWVDGREWASLVKSLKEIFIEKRTWISFSQSLKKNIFYDCYSEMMDIEKSYDIKTWNFILSGPHGLKRYSSRYDVNWVQARKIMDLILYSGNKIGLHGSYYSRDYNSYLLESKRLQEAIGIPIIAHRNHYLRFDSKKLYSQLEKAGIYYDFSVGFSSRIGFRSGMASSYFPYDFEKSDSAGVLEIPLVYMERASHLESESMVLENLSKVLEQVKKYNGCVSILFHPESFAIDARWFKFYEKVINLVISMGADVSSELPPIKNRR